MVASILNKPDWKKIFAKHISDRVLASKKTYKEFLKLNNEKTDNPT